MNESIHINQPYCFARGIKEESSIVDVVGLPIGGPEVVIMAGPCAVENEGQITAIARVVKETGATVLRGGAYKPRTSPYDFQGLGKYGLVLLQRAARIAGLRTVAEVMDPRLVESVAGYVDILQIGTRNMQNIPLLKEVGRTQHPILLKRGMQATYKEFLLAAEYILAEGNENVMLCERGIRTHVSELRFTLDINAIPYLKKETHLPVIVDPSHGTGRRDLVTAVSLAAVAAGADALLIECHLEPEQSVTDAAQAIHPTTLRETIKAIQAVAAAIGREVALPEKYPVKHI